jgi:hypothetical protein
MTVVPHTVAQAVTRTKRVWAIAMVALGVYVYAQYGFETSLFLIPIGLVTYFGAITLTLFAQAKGKTADDFDEMDLENNPMLKALHDDLKAGKVEAGSEEMFHRLRECGMMDILPIGEVSEEIVGTFNGHTMYEWVEIQDPSDGEMKKFLYHSPGMYEGDGTPILPDDDNFIFAHVNGIVYAREA